MPVSIGLEIDFGDWSSGVKNVAKCWKHFNSTNCEYFLCKMKIESLMPTLTFHADKTSEILKWITPSWVIIQKSLFLF